MSDMNDIVRVAVDAYRGRTAKYSTSDAQNSLHQALVAANGGSTTLNYKNIRDGKCNGLFTIVEEVLAQTIHDGLTTSDFFNNFVDYKNVALGDKNLFVMEDQNLFVVDEAADGTQGIRRQRLSGSSEISLPTSFKAIRIYEELNRVLSGKVDFNTMIQKVATSFEKQILDEIFTLWCSITAEQLGGVEYFPAAGAYDEETLLDLIAHVEAASGGQTATLIGTRKSLRNLQNSMQSIDANNDLYHKGVFSTFYGNPVVAVPQRHKAGTKEFIMPDNTITVVAGGDKPIKFVYEGDPVVVMKDAAANRDFTTEYFFGERYGLGVVTSGNSGLGKYVIA